ncbi:alternate-type signal peptide domain-containing protein [Nocardioides caeni]|uniref:Alternate-type signal peptide domain-containing protein n=1 Tax=Nocardioides caeni TaxID=574700 RepID=A0A4S8NEE1_9ACTN|nr:alternate-type signal peptide domain-containing protein [Nocardioides caeni]THV13359.1 alternate-type signal peptide domain-containing protein [Nocardioides caeni]
MKKTTKGALAAGSAAVLLMGGAGTLAFWTDSDVVDGGSVTAGDLSLTTGSCEDWVYADADVLGPGETVNLVVPGDTIEKTCTASIDGTGDHLRATVEIDQASVADISLGSDVLDVSAVLTEPVGADTGVDVDGPTPVSITITVAYPYGDENIDSELATADLDAITLNAVQVHSP